MTDKNNFDVIIIGGSYAGLSAAMALGRSLRHVLIIDSGSPCNKHTPHSHNFITHDGAVPAAIADKAREQVLRYGTVEFRNDLAVSSRKTESGFEVVTRGGDTFTAKKLILATGIRDVLPDIAGFEACWGISVIHCPYCHGYEFRDHRTGIMANGERAFHLASLVHNLTGSIMILTGGKAEFNAGQISKLEKHNIPVIETEISAIEHKDGHVQNVVFNDGTRMAFDALYAAVPFVQHSDIPASLGCELNEQGYIRTDGFHRTTVPGVYACGDNCSMMRSVAYAVSGGNITGAMVNKDLTGEAF